MIRRVFIFSFLVFLALPPAAVAQVRITVDAGNPVSEIQPTMWGIFFEDINFAADGGLYAELVRNRSFQFDDPFMGWEVPYRDSVRLIGEQGNKSGRYLRLESLRSGKPNYIRNGGFRGMGFRSGEEYRLMLNCRLVRGETAGLLAELLNADGVVIGRAEPERPQAEWISREIVIRAAETVDKGSLKITLTGEGAVDLDFVSLFPVNTWKGRKNGLRSDLAGLLAALQPGFIRFPGGCVVEGHHLDLRYEWKKTVGPVAGRKTIINRWNTEFMHRHTPDYFQSFGLGFYEYFQLAEDLGAEPLPILNCGMACQYNTGELAPLEGMQPYIDDALHLIEFANGDLSTRWGKLRAQMGHPEPFNLKFLGIGNEQWGEQYLERYTMIAEKVRGKYPEIRLISGAGPSAEGERFEYLWKELKNKPADLVDEHYYKEPGWFFKSAARYDGYDRVGPKVFAGEYASHTRVKDEDPPSNNNWLSALSEAAFMTGLERNAGVVHMASYAPLLAHREAWQWRPDLIWFDNLHVVATPNYYVQQLFSTHRGTHVVPVLWKDEPLTGKDSLYASGSADQENRRLYLKFVNASSAEKDLEIDLRGKRPEGKEARLVFLEAESLMAYNDFDKPAGIAPREERVRVEKNHLVRLRMKARSVVLVELNYR